MKLMGFALALLAVWIVVPYIAKRVQIARLRVLCRKTRTITLTYDDGPGGELTEKLLKVLETRGGRATFFLLGQKVGKSRTVVEKLCQGGHEIGSHSQNHLNAWKSSPWQVYLDIKRGFFALQGTPSSFLFRAPHGKTTIATLIQVYVRGYRQSWWTIDSTDTWSRLSRVENIVDQVRKEGGGVVLMHDHERKNDPEREIFVLELTIALLDLAAKQRFRVAPLGEVMQLSSDPARGLS